MTSTLPISDTGSHAAAAPRLWTEPLTAALMRLARPKLWLALALSQLLAVWWWGWAGRLRATGWIPVWYDQGATFTQVAAHLGNPYQLPGYINPPWAVVYLLPFNFLPLPLAVLAQLCLYFAILTIIIFRRRPQLRVVLLALTTFTSFDAALQLNVDWIVCLGLLVPAAWSGPFLLVKPQVALGYWFGLSGRTLARAVIVALAVGLLALALWPAWPLSLLDAVARNGLVNQVGNLAPLRWLPAPVALGLGLSLAWQARRWRDPGLGVLAGIFFVPYLQPYSLLLHLALLATRWPRVVLVFSLTMWLVYGGVLAWGLFQLGWRGG